MSDKKFPFFIVTVIRIIENNLARIVKTTSGFLKSNVMFSHIDSKLIRIPLESDQFNLIFLNAGILNHECKRQTIQASTIGDP
jgi:hypothetical protein